MLKVTIYEGIAAQVRVVSHLRRRIQRDAASDRKAGTATAARGGVGVGDLERRAAEILDIVDRRTVEQVEADGVDDERHAIGFDRQIIVGDRAHFEAIGEACAPSAVDREAENGGLALPGGNEGDALGGAGGEGEAGHPAEIGAGGDKDKLSAWRTTKARLHRLVAEILARMASRCRSTS